MRIMHVGPFKLGTMNGTYNALWNLASGQAAQGHQVTIVRLGKAVTSAERDVAGVANIDLVGYPCDKWRGFDRDSDGRFAEVVSSRQPDVTHLQYVRIPKYDFISRYCLASSIPVVVSPHGGLNPTEMRRHRLRKLAYWHAIERRVHQRIAGVHFVSDREHDNYVSTSGLEPRVSAVVPNVVRIPDEMVGSWRHDDGGVTRLAYFGRYDIWTKGLDLAASLARHLRTEGVACELHLHGEAGPKFEGAFRQLVGAFSDVAIVDHGPSRDESRFASLASYDAYLQYSRFEAFGMSIVEAMRVGLPAIVSEACDHAQAWAHSDAAFTIPMNPRVAASSVATFVNDSARLEQISRSGIRWAEEACGPRQTSARMDDFYRRAAATLN